MKAAQYSSYGGHQVIKITNDAPMPEPRDEQVVVQVHAGALNPVDWKIRAGYMQQYLPLTFPATIGGDFAGEVVQVGPGATRWQVGDRVYGMASVMSGSSGSLAEYTTANAGQIGHKPRSVTDAAAAAAVLAGICAVQAMDDLIHAAPGLKVLVHGGGGGVGSFAIQYAKHLGAHVATTVRAERHAFVGQLGADEILDYERQSFETVLHDYDAVLDTVGGETYAKSYQVLKPGGIIVSLVEQPNAALMAECNVRAVFQMGDVSTARLDRLAHLIDSGAIKVYIDQIFTLDQAQDAFDYLEHGHPQGKVVVQIR
jgi:NADPH:quinone reductase-like Zn-dependent oxidoreductase